MERFEKRGAAAAEPGRDLEDTGHVPRMRRGPVLSAVGRSRIRLRTSDRNAERAASGGVSARNSEQHFSLPHGCETQGSVPQGTELHAAAPGRRGDPDVDGQGVPSPVSLFAQGRAGAVGIGSAVVDLIFSIANREVTFLSGTAAIRRL